MGAQWLRAETRRRGGPCQEGGVFGCLGAVKPALGVHGIPSTTDSGVDGLYGLHER
jgi:hypothetical protein